MDSNKDMESSFTQPRAVADPYLDGADCAINKQPKQNPYDAYNNKDVHNYYNYELGYGQHRLINEIVELKRMNELLRKQCPEYGERNVGNTKLKVQSILDELEDAFKEGANAFSPTDLLKNGTTPGYAETSNMEWTLKWRLGYEIAKNEYLLDEANIQIKQLKKDRDYYGERAETNAEKLKVFAECSKEEINKLETKLFKLKCHLNMSLKDIDA